MKEITLRPVPGNCTETVRSILQSAENGTVIRFEKGIYRFYEQGTHTGIFHPSNNASGEKKVVFYLSGKKDLTILGNGAEFRFCQRVFPFLAENCENITLEDFGIDFDFPTYCETAVERVTENGVVLRCLQNDLTPGSDPDGALLIQSGNRQYSNAVKRFFLSNRTNNAVHYLEAPTNCQSRDDLPAPVLVAKAAADGSRVTLTFCGTSAPAYRAGDQVIIGFDENRENDVIFADRVKGLRLDRVHIFRGAGMGLLAQMCENVTVRNCCFAAGRHPNETFALTADELMFVQCCGKVVIRNNILCDSLDDAINIHGTYTRIRAVVSETEIEAEFCQHEQGCTGFCEADDTLIVSDGRTGTEKAALHVASAAMISDRIAVIRLAQPLPPSVAAGDLLENRQRSPEVEITDNFIKNCPNLRVSSAKPIRIVHNTIATVWCGLVIADLMQHWYESGKVYQATVEGNTFCDTTPAGKLNGISISHSKEDACKGYHENISILNNKFILKNGVAVKADHVRNLEIRGNLVNTANVTELRHVILKETVGS